MTAPIPLFLLLNTSHILIISITFLTAFTAVVINLFLLIRKLNKNKKLIKQSKKHLSEIQKAREQLEKQKKK